MLNIIDNLLNSEVRDCESSEIYSLCNQRVSLPQFWQKDTRQSGNLLLVAMVIARPIFCLCFLCLDSHRATLGSQGVYSGRHRGEDPEIRELWKVSHRGYWKAYVFTPDWKQTGSGERRGMPLSLGYYDSHIS